MGSRRFDQLPALHKREVRLEGATLDQVAQAFQPITRRRQVGQLMTVGLIAAGAAAAYTALNWNLGHPDAQREVFTLLGFRERGHADLKGALWMGLLFGPAAAMAVSGVVTFFRLPPPLAAAVVPALLRAVPELLSGPLSVSVCWGLFRPGDRSGQFANSELAVAGTLRCGAPFLLTVDASSSTTRSTGFSAGGAGVQRSTRTRYSRTLRVAAEAVVGEGLAVVDPLPASEGVVRGLHTDGEQRVLRAELSLRDADCSARDLERVLRAVAQGIAKT